MGYTTRDLAWYAAFIAGCSLTFLSLGAFGFESYWPKIIVAGLVGVGLGFGAQQLLPPPDRDAKKKDPRE